MDDDSYITDWIPLNKRDHLSFAHICGIASGTLVTTLLWLMIFTLFEPLSEKVNLVNWIRTLILFYGSLAGFVICPVLGVYSDALTFKWGRRRIYMLVGGVVLIISFLFMIYCVDIGRWILPSQPDGNNLAQKLILIASLLISFTAGNAVQAPARALCFDVTPQKQMILMSNIMQVYSGVSGILANSIGAFKLYIISNFDQEPFLLMVCLSVIFLALTISIIVSHEEPLQTKPPIINPFKQIWEALKKIPKAFKRIILPFLFAYMAIYQFQFQFSHFMGEDVFGGSNVGSLDPSEKTKYQDGVSWSMACNAVSSIFQFGYGFLNTKVSELIGMKAVMILGLFLVTVSFFCFFFNFSKYVYLGLTIPIGIGSLIFNAIPYTVVSLVTPTEELGANLGLLNCFGIIGQQISNFGITFGIGSFYNDNSKMMIAFSFIPGLIGMISAFFMVTPRATDLSEYNQIRDRRSTEVSSSFISSEKF